MEFRKDARAGSHLFLAGAPHLRVFSRLLGRFQQHLLHRRANHRRWAAASGAGERAGGGDGGAVAEPPSVDQVLREHGCLQSHRQQLLGYRDRLAKTQGQLAETNKQLSQTSQKVMDTNKRINELDQYELVKLVTVPLISTAQGSRMQQRTLDELASKAPGAKNYLVEVKGYADPTGDFDKNLKLGQDRSEAVVQYLTVKGQIPLRRIMVPMGY